MKNMKFATVRGLAAYLLSDPGLNDLPLDVVYDVIRRHLAAPLYAVPYGQLRKLLTELYVASGVPRREAARAVRAWDWPDYD